MNKLIRILITPATNHNLFKSIHLKLRRKYYFYFYLLTITFTFTFYYYYYYYYYITITFFIYSIIEAQRSVNNASNKEKRKEKIEIIN